MSSHRAAGGADRKGVIAGLLVQGSEGAHVDRGLDRITPSGLRLFFGKAARAYHTCRFISPSSFGWELYVRNAFPHSRRHPPSDGIFGYPSWNLPKTRRNPYPADMTVADRDGKAGLILGEKRPVEDRYFQVLTWTPWENETQCFIFAPLFLE